MTTIPTQSDIYYPRTYIVTQFDNILIANMTGTWRTALVDHVVFNIPVEFPAITGGYCFAGTNIADCSATNYYEFPCQVTGARQVTFYFDPYVTGDELFVISIAYRAWTPLGNPTGTTSSSTATSYANPTLNWVIDENTGYNFYIDPTPTPILRDVNLNLKSFYDLQPSIGDLVMLYGAIWPNTLQTTSQIT